MFAVISESVKTPVFRFTFPIGRYRVERRPSVFGEKIVPSEILLKNVFVLFGLRAPKSPKLSDLFFAGES